MKQIPVYFPKSDPIPAVKSFVDTVSGFDTDFDLHCGRYVVDAKSIMGVLSLNLSEPIMLQIYAEEPVLSEILSALSPFLAKAQA